MTSAAKDLVTGLDPDGDRFWEGVAAGAIPLRHCTRCDTHIALPLPSCPECGAEPLEDVASAGAGSLYSWVVVHYAWDEVLAAEVPYVVGAVELDEGARIFGRVEGLEPAAGARLVATFPDGSDRPPIVFVPEASA